MIKHFETEDLRGLAAFIEARTDQLAIEQASVQFAAAIVEAAITSEVEYEKQPLPEPEQITTVFKLLSGSYTTAAHPDHRLPGLRYEVHITMPSARTYDGYSYFTQGGGGKLIDFLIETEVEGWMQD